MEVKVLVELKAKSIEKTFTYNYKIEPINKIFPNDCIRKNKSKIK